MPLSLTIEKAAAIAGSQSALAKLLGDTPQHVSNMKHGSRKCTLSTRLKIARIAGTDTQETILEFLVDELDKNDPDQAAVAITLQAVLAAFNPTDPPTGEQSSKSKPKARK